MIGGFLASCALEAPGLCLVKIDEQAKACLSAVSAEVRRNRDWTGLAVAFKHHPRPHYNDPLPSMTLVYIYLWIS